MYQQTLILTFLFLASFTTALDMKSAYEMPCFNVTNTVPVDGKWATTIENLYVLWMSRSDAYRSAADLLQKNPKDILESELYYDSCARWRIFPNGTILHRGFNNFSRKYTPQPIKPAPLEEFRFGPSEGKVYGYSGVKYTTMTDNSTFLVTPFCTDDGEMTWAMAATTTTLPQNTVDSILQHVESLGFKREYFTQIRFDSCSPDQIS